LCCVTYRTAQKSLMERTDKEIELYNLRWFHRGLAQTTLYTKTPCSFDATAEAEDAVFPAKPLEFLNLILYFA